MKGTAMTAACLCGFTELDDENLTDHILAVFAPADSRGADGLIHEEGKPLACACGFAAITAEELDLHFLRMFVPANRTDPSGKKHEVIE
jgi:hypothetical protein